MHTLEKIALWQTVRALYGIDDANDLLAVAARVWEPEEDNYEHAAGRHAAELDFVLRELHRNLRHNGQRPIRFATPLGTPTRGFTCLSCGAVNAAFMDRREEPRGEGNPELGQVVDDGICRACGRGQVLTVLAYRCPARCGEIDGSMHTADLVPGECLGAMLIRASEDAETQARREAEEIPDTIMAVIREI